MITSLTQLFLSSASGSTFPNINLNSLELHVTHRVTHQLVTRIFAIFLKEILGYKNITFDSSLDLLQSISNNEQSIEYAPLHRLRVSQSAAINLDVWVTPDSHVTFPDNVIQGGSLSYDLARYGLFIQESFGSRIYSYTDFISSSSSYHETVKEFKMDDGMVRVLKSLVETADNFTGIYEPQQCTSATEP